MADHEAPRDIEAEIAEWRQLHPAAELDEQWLREHPDDRVLVRLASGQAVMTRCYERPLRMAANDLFAALYKVSTVRPDKPLDDGGD